ncbi:hypothetical protein FACS1894201_08800 [Bacteroidia bacterium]|nr:hypothetical protein FACS1894201_08800 [Bacteroidia bacterium]
MRSLKIVILSVLGILSLLNGNAQQVFYSQKLQNLYYSLPDECRGVLHTSSTTVDTLVLCRDVVQGDIVPLVYRWDENGVLEHIGYRFLQSDSIKMDDVVIRFVEKELLAMLLSNNINQTLAEYRENGLSIALNHKPITQNTLQNKRNLLNMLKNNIGISINFDGKNYDVTLLAADEQKLFFQFKADSELLTGMDKKERDIRLAVQLKNYHAAKKTGVFAPDYRYLRLLRDSIYVDKGSEFMIPQINNDLFYLKEDSIYTLALDTSFVAESFSNALLVPSAKNYTINITHRMYGKIVEKYTVRSRDFYDYFSHNYDRYFGTESLEKEKLTGTLILSDRNAGCIHLAFVSVSLDNLLNGGTMEMQLYSNIPQQNIKTLFGNTVKR